MIESKKAPQMTGQPAGAPLSWSMKLQFIELDLYDFTFKFRRFSIRGKKGHLPALIIFALKDINGFTPRGMLTVVYFSKVEHLSLHDLIVCRALVFDDTPIAMFFAVLESAFRSKKHAPIVRNDTEKSRG